MTTNDQPTGKVWLITGASSGIGRQIALDAAVPGNALVLGGLARGAELDAVGAEAVARGADCVTAVGDVTSAGVVEDLVQRALSHFGRIDVLISNAGKGLTAPLGEITEDGFEHMWRLHVRAPFVACQCAAETLRQTKGSVVIVSSIAAIRAIGGRLAYATAKAAQIGFTRTLAAEWAGDGVRVNAVLPGTILTPGVEKNFELGLLDRDGVLDRTPLGRLGTPQEVSKLVHFLASSEQSGYITGQSLLIDGGWSIYGGWS